MEKIEYDILMRFHYGDDDYVIFTDNTYDNDNLNLYGARLDSEERLIEYDEDMDEVFDMMINKYKEKLLKGEV